LGAAWERPLAREDILQNRISDAKYHSQALHSKSILRRRICDDDVFSALIVPAKRHRNCRLRATQLGVEIMNVSCA
jgi:hypothetical protein